jgi:NAD(P)-dependent dehydrogenase (short-subunit alcohol dehydrogenase family)
MGNLFATYPSLRSRVVVITGGASGIGEAMVVAFMQQGAKVVFLDVQREAAEALLARLAKAGMPVEGGTLPAFVQCDVTDVEALQRAASAIVTDYGTVDVLVNNAGNDTRHSLEEVTPDSWDRSIAVNLKHQFFMTQAVVPAMRAAGRGAVIHMSSIGWVIPSVHLSVYVTAKAAIVGLTRTLAHELGADGIRVNCVMPGAILTERQSRVWFTKEYKTEILARQALKRFLLPEEVARLVLFLAADDSAGITNQSHVIDGGWV